MKELSDNFCKLLCDVWNTTANYKLNDPHSGIKATVNYFKQFQ